MAPTQPPKLYDPEGAEKVRASNEGMTKARARGRVTASRSSAASSSSPAIRASGVTRALNQSTSNSSPPSFNIIPPSPKTPNDENRRPAGTTDSTSARRNIIHGIAPVGNRTATTAASSLPHHKLALAKAKEATALAEQNKNREAEDEKRTMAAFSSSMSGAERMLAFAKQQELQKAAGADDAANKAAVEESRKAKIEADKKAAEQKAESLKLLKAAEEARKAKIDAEQKAAAEAEEALKAKAAAEKKAFEEAEKVKAAAKAAEEAEKLKLVKAAQDAEKAKAVKAAVAGPQSAIARVRAMQGNSPSVSENAVAAEAAFKTAESSQPGAQANDTPTNTISCGPTPDSFKLSKQGQSIATAKVTNFELLEPTSAEIVAEAKNILCTIPTRVRPEATAEQLPPPTDAELLDSLADLIKEHKMLEHVAKEVKGKLAKLNAHIAVKHEQVLLRKKAH
ncbi:Hypothetical predicted protein [Lecanosticta acicola]|uniref:Uncharacterized protein n=1 Tax=Lecanosticta acicola TaxID=111012 RepID=A0AAI8W114_9PEZI|nr:Hypothetical predicted protein [Lecanosticta acicola]